MKSLLTRRSARALAVAALMLWGGGRFFLTSAHSTRAPLAVPLALLQEEAALGEKVSLFDGRVSFSPPAGFAKMTEEMMSKKYPELNVPKVAYSNAETTVSVVAGFAEERNLRPEQLPEFKDFFSSALEKAVPELQWLKKELVEIDGRRWVHLEYVARRAGSREVHNDTYTTSLDGRIMFFNFNSAVDVYEKSKGVLQKSRATIAVKGP